MLLLNTIYMGLLLSVKVKALLLSIISKNGIFIVKLELIFSTKITKRFLIRYFWYCSLFCTQSLPSKRPFHSLWLDAEGYPRWKAHAIFFFLHLAPSTESMHRLLWNSFFAIVCFFGFLFWRFLIVYLTFSVDGLTLISVVHVPITWTLALLLSCDTSVVCLFSLNSQ